MIELTAKEKAFIYRVRRGNRDERSVFPSPPLTPAQKAELLLELDNIVNHGIPRIARTYTDACNYAKATREQKIRWTIEGFIRDLTQKEMAEREAITPCERIVPFKDAGDMI